MVKLLCHAVSQKAELFKIIPQKENIQSEFVLYLKSCVICNNPVLEIIRIDNFNNKLAPVRLKTKNIPKFLDSMSVIWKPEKINYINSAFSGFALGYNHYGTRKKCFQNISNLRIGKIETDPFANLRSYKADLCSMR